MNLDLRSLPRSVLLVLEVTLVRISIGAFLDASKYKKNHLGKEFISTRNAQAGDHEAT